MDPNAAAESNTGDPVGPPPLGTRESGNDRSVRRRGRIILGLIAVGAVAAAISVPRTESTPAGVFVIDARPLFRGDAAPVGAHLGVVGGGEYRFRYQGKRAFVRFAREIWSGGRLLEGSEWGDYFIGSKLRGVFSFCARKPDDDPKSSRLRFTLNLTHETPRDGEAAPWATVFLRDEVLEPPPDVRVMPYVSNVGEERIELRDGEERVLWFWLDTGDPPFTVPDSIGSPGEKCRWGIRLKIGLRDENEGDRRDR